jgi:Sulfate permease family
LHWHWPWLGHDSGTGTGISTGTCPDADNGPGSCIGPGLGLVLG